MPNVIKSNTCPYCGAPYTLNDAGCRAQCAAMAYVHKLVHEAAEEDERRDPREGEP